MIINQRADDSQPVPDDRSRCGGERMGAQACQGHRSTIPGQPKCLLDSGCNTAGLEHPIIRAVHAVLEDPSAEANGELGTPGVPSSPLASALGSSRTAWTALMIGCSRPAVLHPLSSRHLGWPGMVER